MRARIRSASPSPRSERPVAVRGPSRRIERLTAVLFCCVFQLAVLGSAASKIDGGWDTEPNTQYHIQTDEGPERYFKYQTISGQYRKERRLQDGSVVGTYGWVDADGYLRLNDYVADSKGYRVVKNKKLFVGTQAPVGQAVSTAKYAPAIAGTADSSRSSYRSAGAAAVSATAARPEPAAVVAITPAPPRHSSWRGSPFVYPSDSQSPPLLFPSSTPAAPGRSQYRRPQLYRPSSTAAAPHYSVRPVDVNSIATTDDDDDDDSSPQPEYRRRFSSSSTPATSAAAEQLNVRPHTFRPAYRKVVDVSGQGSEPAEVAALQYDGVSFVRNGFRYYLPRHYHEERSEGDSRTGSFGYVDPFGIRRVVYYNAAPGSGFVHRKNNRYVGLDAEPYDPRPSHL